MPVVKVTTPKYFTVPKSASVSMSASAAPAAIAGRASGSETVAKVAHALRPRLRAASRIEIGCSRKAARVSR